MASLKAKGILQWTGLKSGKALLQSSQITCIYMIKILVCKMKLEIHNEYTSSDIIV